LYVSGCGDAQVKWCNWVIFTHHNSFAEALSRFSFCKRKTVFEIGPYALFYEGKIIVENRLYFSFYSGGAAFDRRSLKLKFAKGQWISQSIETL
jgi:hypothetical protein